MIETNQVTDALPGEGKCQGDGTYGKNRGDLVEKPWEKKMWKLWVTHGKPWEKTMGKLWETLGKNVETWKNHGKKMWKLWGVNTIKGLNGLYGGVHHKIMGGTNGKLIP